MASTAALYTPEVLALATSLASFPLEDNLRLRGHARSAACGSTLELGIELDCRGRIARLGLRAHACAIGQAAAAIFAGAAIGRNHHDLQIALAGIEAWLEGSATSPDWPGLTEIAAARGYPARHGAILLGWRAALDALPSRGNPR